jgi:hypothetical protein
MLWMPATAENIPQGLKASFIVSLFGTSKLVPCYKARHESIPAASHTVSTTLPFSSILPKIILPLAVCSTLVTEMSTERPIMRRA